jgi:predicted DCC family thiol-disulfide oxidoreductase YuxK
VRADSLATDDRGWTCNLAIVRVVFLGGIALPFAWLIVRWVERIMPGLPPEAWRPVSFYAFLPLDVVRDARIAHALALADLVLIGLATLGVFTRWTLGLATVVSLYVFGLGQNQGKIDHYHHIVWFMALLAAGPSARVLSVDALRAAVRDADRGLVEPRLPAGAALATLRWLWLLFGLLYLAPGLAKLDKALTAGWTSAESLRAILWAQWLKKSLYAVGFSQPTWLAELPAPVLTLAGTAVILFEVLFIVLVFVRPVRPWLACAGLAFHRGTQLAIGISFGHLTPAYVALLDWAAIGRALRRRLAGEPLEVLYDGDCRLCRRAIALIRSLDLWDAIVPVAASDPRRRAHPALTDEMLARDLHAVAGARIARGYDAYVWIASRIPLLWPLALLMRVPPVAAVGRRLYRRVADTRACAVAAPVAPSAGPSPAARAVTVIGLALAIGQAIVSGGQLVASIRGDVQGLARWSRIAWPFDHYPRFAEDRPREQLELWEPRAVFPDGREARVTPDAFRRAFGHPAKSTRLSQQVLSITDPSAQRTLSLELLRTLWARERPAVRARAVEVRVYAVTYGIGPARPTIVGERLLHRIALDELGR